MSLSTAAVPAARLHVATLPAYMQDMNLDRVLVQLEVTGLVNSEK